MNREFELTGVRRWDADPRGTRPVGDHRGGLRDNLIIVLATSRLTWLYFRSLRLVAAGALAAIGGDIPLVAADAATHHALATLTVLLVAMLMAGCGAFFAVR